MRKLLDAVDSAVRDLGAEGSDLQVLEVVTTPPTLVAGTADMVVVDEASQP